MSAQDAVVHCNLPRTYQFCFQVRNHGSRGLSPALVFALSVVQLLPQALDFSTDTPLFPFL